MARNPGLRGTVRTTLDLDLQWTVERLVRSHLSALNRHDITQAAVVVVENETGAIRAMAGSENYAVSQVNGATQPRSCGSTLKPFVYLEAIDKQLFTAASLLPDTPDAIRNEYADYRSTKLQSSLFWTGALARSARLFAECAGCVCAEPTRRAANVLSVAEVGLQFPTGP